MVDAEGPEEFCDRVRARLVGALTLATGRRDVAEELAQESLVRAWERWDRVSGLASPEQWTMRVGFNLAKSWHRRRLAEWRANRRTGAAEMVAWEGDGADVVAVRAAVAGLPERQRAVVIARFFLGYDVKGAAALLGCAEGTVKAATHQALANLRRSGLVDDDEVDIEEVVRP